MTPYREPPAGAPDTEVVALDLPRPSLVTEYTVGFVAALVVSGLVLATDGPSAFVVLWPPFAGLVAWYSLGAVRGTTLTVRAAEAGFAVALEQSPALRAPVQQVFTARRQVSLKLERLHVARGWSVLVAALRGEAVERARVAKPEEPSDFSVLQLVVDGRAVLALEIVRSAARERLVMERVKSFNDRAAVLTNPAASTAIARFLLALPSDDVAKVSALLQDDLSVDAVYEEDTLVEHAALAGAPKVLAKLLELGGKPSPRALAVAAWTAPSRDPNARARHVACAELLLAAGVTLDAPAVDAGTAREAFAHAGEPFTTMAARIDAARARSAPRDH